MISASDRRIAVELISEAVDSGVALYKACEELGISKRTYNRWKSRDSDYIDKRTTCERPEPANKLSQEEKKQILETMNSEEFSSKTPSEIVPISTHKATAPNQVWMWDITYLNGRVKGTYYYLYLFSDLLSRKIIGWEVWETETSEHASELVKRIYREEKIFMNAEPLVLHSDNGSPMKGATMLETLYALGVVPSRSRPRVSNDNPYAESLFLKGNTLILISMKCSSGGISNTLGYFFYVSQVNYESQ